jgi:hypothetical protein
MTTSTRKISMSMGIELTTNTGMPRSAADVGREASGLSSLESATFVVKRWADATILAGVRTCLETAKAEIMNHIVAAKPDWKKQHEARQKERATANAQAGTFPSG